MKSADRAGAKYRPAERIGAHRNASDHIIPFAAFADGTSSFRIPFITEHTETAGWLASLFLRAEVRASGNTLVVHGQDARSLRRFAAG